MRPTHVYEVRLRRDRPVTGSGTPNVLLIITDDVGFICSRRKRSAKRRADFHGRFLRSEDFLLQNCATLRKARYGWYLTDINTTYRFYLLQEANNRWQRNRVPLLQSATQSFAAVSHDAVIRVYDAAGNVIETHEHAGDFKEW